MNWDGLNSFWHDSHRILFSKDCRSMADLPDESVQMVCCSPPYWGLRRYAGLPDLIWDGEEDCQHEWGELKKTIKHHSGETNPGLEAHFKDAGANDDAGSSFCSLCGAWKGQLGLEPTPEMYIAHLVEIMREVRRVLRKDGVVFLNIGDSYVSGKSRYSSKSQTISGKDRGDVFQGKPDQYYHPVLKDKDLCLIPFRLAIALQEDGWWVRSVIIWNKPNPMPESVTDRPTESHEYILMLTKSARYFWDAEAVREKATYPDRWGNHNKIYDESQKDSLDGSYSGRNLRSVWTFPTQPYKFAHFAVYPEELVRRCVLAATPEVGCCSKCGKPWVRIVESKSVDRKRPNGVGTDERPDGQQAGWVETQTLGWKAQCKCGLPQSENMGSIVLDPFAGSGTTLKVAAELNRRAIGYELSEQYCKLAVERNKQSVMG